MAEAGAAKVWLDYTQEELDYNYDQRALVTNFQQYIDHWIAESARVRETMDGTFDVPYGPSPDEVLDIFPAAPGSPVVVYLHGGAWRGMHKDWASYPAPAFVPAGATYVAVNFALVPAVTLDEQVRQSRAAIDWVWRNAGEIGVDAERLYVAGNSSGGHLTGVMITTDWEREHGLPRNVIKGALACSGMYELEPVRLSKRGDYVKLGDAAVDRLSPIRHIPDDGCPIVIGYGEGEHREFRRQSREFAAAWRARGLVCHEFDVPGRNHFDMNNVVADPDCPIMKSMFEIMGL